MGYDAGHIPWSGLARKRVAQTGRRQRQSAYRACIPALFSQPIKSKEEVLSWTRCLFADSRFLTTIGVYEWEKGHSPSSVSTSRWGLTTAPPPQPTISIWRWITPPSPGKICDHAQSKIVELVETMAEQVAALVLDDDRVQWVR